MKSLQRFEWMLPASAGLCLSIYTLMVSPDRPMWLDELYTYYGLAHDSFGAFLRSYATGINATPPLYFLFTWAVSRVVPLSALSLRLYSSLACGVAFFLIWSLLRRHLGFFVSSAATLTACMASGLFRNHNSEARFYGLYFALVAWETYQYDRICTTASPSTGRLVGNSLSHALAVSCTFVALFYSFATLLSLLVTDRSLRIWRPKVYLSVMAGWLPLLLYAPMIATARGATSWIPRPGLSAALAPFHPAFDLYFVGCAIAGLVAVAVLQGRGKSSEAASGHPGETKQTRHLIIIGFAFLAVPYELLLISWVWVPLLLDRYALPSLIGVALLLGLAFSRLLHFLSRRLPDRETSSSGAGRTATPANILCTVLLVAMLVYPLGKAIGGSPTEDPRVDEEMATGEMAVASTDRHSYFPLYFQSGESGHIFLIVREANERDRLARFNHRLNPITLDDFLAAHRQFRIYSVDPPREWLVAELRLRGGYRITLEDRAENAELLQVVAQR